MRKVSEVMDEIRSLQEYEMILSRLADSMKDKEFNHTMMSRAGVGRQEIFDMRAHIADIAMQLEYKLKQCEVDM